MTQKRAIEVIDRNARAQVQLIDDLLDLSRIMTGKLRLDLHQVSFASVVEAAVDSAMPAAEAKGIRLKAILGASQDIVSADGARLQQVVWNLLTNAIKFTPKGGQVQVLLQRVNSHLELSVSDTGIGIPASYLPHVFDRFSQKDSSTTRAFGGLGLGLAICKQLVELHGWLDKGRKPGRRQGRHVFRPSAPVDCSAGGRELAAHPSDSGDSTRRGPLASEARRTCMFSSWTMNPMRASCYERCWKIREPR